MIEKIQEITKNIQNLKNKFEQNIEIIKEIFETQDFLEEIHNEQELNQ